MQVSQRYSLGQCKYHSGVAQGNASITAVAYDNAGITALKTMYLSQRWA